MRPSFALLLLALAPAAPAQARSVTGPTFEGRVVDGLGEPIPAAAVVALVEGRAVARTAADGEGIYRIQLPATGAELRVRAAGKVEARLPWRGLATPLVRNAVLEDGATLAGTVFDADGHAVAKATVVVVALGTTSLTTTTDERGSYTFSGVPLRPLLLHAAGENARVDTTLRLVADARHDLILPRPTHGDCLVHVSDLPAMAAGQAVVRVFGADVAAVRNGGRVPLRADGTAALSLRSDCLLDVPLARFALAPEARFAGPSTRRADFVVTGPRDASATTSLVRGRVRTLTDRVVGGVRLVVRDRSHCEIGSALVDHQGEFQLPLVMPPDGFCRLGLDLGDWLLVDDEASIVDGFCWVPFPNVSKRLDLLAERTGVLSSVVRGPDGSQFLLAEIVVADTERLHRALVRTHTDLAGHFTVGLPAGDHELLAVSHDGQVARATLRIDAGRHHEVQWQAVATGEVAGVLRDAAGTGIPGVELLVASTDLQGPGGARASDRQRCTLVTDRQGRFRCRGLPAGSWTVVATDDSRVVGTAVDVQAGRATGVDLAYTR